MPLNEDLTPNQWVYALDLVEDYVQNGYGRAEAWPLAIQVAKDAYWIDGVEETEGGRRPCSTCSSSRGGWRTCPEGRIYDRFEI